jgi:hypothetical protein
MPERIPLSPGPANQHHPTSVTVEPGPLLPYLRVVRVMLTDLESWWVETVRVGHGWVPNGVLVGGDSAAAGEERTCNHMYVRYPLVGP